MWSSSAAPRFSTGPLLPFLDSSSFAATESAEPFLGPVPALNVSGSQSGERGLGLGLRGELAEAGLAKASLDGYAVGSGALSVFVFERSSKDEARAESGLLVPYPPPPLNGDTKRGLLADGRRKSGVRGAGRFFLHMGAIAYAPAGAHAGEVFVGAMRGDEVCCLSLFKMVSRSLGVGGAGKRGVESVDIDETE